MKGPRDLKVYREIGCGKMRRKGGFGLQVPGSRLRFAGSGFGLSCFGLRVWVVQAVVFRVWGLGCAGVVGLEECEGGVLSGFEFQAQGSGFSVCGSGFGVLNFGVGVSGFRFRFQFRILGLGFGVRIQNSEFRVQG